VATRLETPTRRCWCAVISRYADSEDPEYRRSDQRSYVEIGAVQLSYADAEGITVVRMGRLLNASEGGLMVKLVESIPAKTEVQVEVAIDDVAFTIPGRVVHATETVGGFKIGVELEFAD
jgi:uncharacterized membrane protein